MLRLNNLDDMRFAEISERARMKISEYFPQWSDLNTHDPGITLIELLAWLTEQQRFYMNQSEEAYPFFPLLNITIRRASAAEAQVEIPGGYTPRLIRANTTLYAEDVRFETIETQRYVGMPTTVRIIQRETVQTPVTLGEARGYPGESFIADTKGQIALDFALTVSGDMWMMTDDFRTSRPEDRHYTLSRETGEITFGDGFRGALPYGEVVITHMTLTLGPGGNIAPDRITELDGLPVTQPKAAEGGALRETVDEALRRAAASRRQAVTAADIEQLVLETPGLDIERTRACCDDSKPRLGAPRVANIAVKLRSGDLTEEAKRVIREWLEPYRLVCRDFHIAAPNTVHVSLGLELSVGPHGAGYKKMLESLLRAYFVRTCGGFGAVLRVSELRAFVADLPEVLDVTRCAFRVYGSARTTADGDVMLEPDAIAELADISIGIHVR